nr:transposon TX1 putative 149 kDa protein [Tanacetum cinerariifolium]
MSESSSLDAPFTTLEIKDTVWSCGGEKAPGLDGFTFKSIKHYWDTIGNDFIEMLKRFKVDGNIPRVNAACYQLVLLVYNVTTVFNKVNAASLRVTTANRVITAGWIKTEMA